VHVEKSVKFIRKSCRRELNGAEMKKRIFLLGTLGLTAGFLYVLEANRRRENGNEDALKRRSKDSEPAVKHSGPTALRSEARKSIGATHGTASIATMEKGKVLPDERAQPSIDDKGTNQLEASQILKNIRDGAFDASDEKLALALGRPTEEIEQWINGNGLIDGDVIMKARTLAMQRGFDAE
jgi:hypothetical protein